MTERSKARESDLRAVAEALADVLVERGLLVSAEAESSLRVLDAAQVGTLLGRDRQWVYDHAGELGAFRFGDGPRARIGFDLATVERWKRERQIRQTNSQTPRTRSQPKGRAASAPRLLPYEAHELGS